MKAKVMAILFLFLIGGAPAESATRQQQVRSNSVKVMPFSMSGTMHSFASDATGGVMTVVTRKPDARQTALIRAHLRKEAAAFAAGDYADPSTIHGGTMPGLAALSAGALRVAVRYGDVANGAHITFRSRDHALIAAVHRWFAAQISDHGHDAMPM